MKITKQCDIGHFSKFYPCEETRSHTINILVDDVSLSVNEMILARLSDDVSLSVNEMILAWWSDEYKNLVEENNSIFLLDFKGWCI